MNEVNSADPEALIEDLRGFAEFDADLNITFGKPQMQQSQNELEDSVIKRLESGLMTKVEAIAELRDISKEDAEQVLEQMREELQLEMQDMMLTPQSAEQLGEDIEGFNEQDQRDEERSQSDN